MNVAIINTVLIVSAIYTFLRSPEKALLNIFLPLLLFIPQIFDAKVPGLPALRVAQAAIIPIFIIHFITKFFELSMGMRRRNAVRISLMDFLVVFYIIFCVYSEEINEGTSMSVNLLAGMLSSVLAPFILAKMLIMPKNLSIAFAKRFVFCIFIIIILSLYEMRFTLNPFLALIRPFFPGQGEEWPTLYRWGFVRIGGPFIQPIIFAMVISVALFFDYWLYRNRLWERYFKYLPISKRVVITLVLLFGFIMTFSRGPILSTLLGMLFVGIGFSRYKKISLTLRCIIIGLFAVYTIWAFYEISGVGIGLAQTAEEATIAYRGELIRQYVSIAMQKPWWGWGIELWPKVPGLSSVDNHYLWVALKHGFIPIGVFTFMIFYTFVRLLKRGIFDNPTQLVDCSLAFTFAAILISFAVCLTTVFLGLQLEPLFFLLLGWMEGFLLSNSISYTPVKVARRQNKQIKVMHAAPSFF